MFNKGGKETRQTRKYLLLSMPPACLFLLLSFAFPAPWNQYLLVLAIGFFVMALGVIVTR
jgi:hypothetical protein